MELIHETSYNMPYMYHSSLMYVLGTWVLDNPGRCGGDDFDRYDTECDLWTANSSIQLGSYAHVSYVFLALPRVEDFYVHLVLPVLLCLLSNCDLMSDENVKLLDS